MRIAMVAPEVAPYSKTGGLGDVIGSLPGALDGQDDEVVVITPLYDAVRENAQARGLELKLDAGPSVSVPVGDFDQTGACASGRLPNTNVTVYFLEHDGYFGRPGLYTDPEDRSDYQDNSERFIFLSRGALELLRALDFQPDIVHSHDWHTGLVPIYLEHKYREDFPETASAFTVHNLAYQGLFWHWDMKLTNLSWDLFNWKMLEYYGNLSLLKAGLVGADVITTVSKQYAREIQTEEYGMGMHGVFQQRSGDLFGIVNGVDYQVWNPATDPHIPENYSEEDLSGKAACKRTLQQEFGLPEQEETALVGMIGRLVEQKGIDLAAEGMDEMMRRNMQMVILGTGEDYYHDMLSALADRYPEQMGLRLDFDEPLAHRIEAGSDMFLMPSRFEPCGLNQLYSMKYGTVPVVSATGGLVDTVVDYREEAGRETDATGFMFQTHCVVEMVDALDRALRLYAHSPGQWRELMLRGMLQEWSWERSASEYREVYKNAQKRRLESIRSSTAQS